MTLSTRDQIIVSVAVALMLALMLTFGGYMAGLQTRQNAATLAAEGVIVDGKITSKVERFGGIVNGPKYTWWLDVTYTSKDGETHAKTIGVDQSAYERTSIGPIAVTYIRSNPSLFYIAGLYDGANHSEADVEVVGAMTFYGGIASIVLGFVLAALLITRGGGGAPASQGQVKPPSGRQTGEISRQQPGQFGKRGRAA